MSLFLKPVIGVAVNIVALFFLTKLVDGIVYTGGWEFFLVAGFVLAILNFIVKPLLKIVALPLVFITGGLFLIVINVFILWFLSYFLDVAQFHGITLLFQNTTVYVIGAVVFGLINWILSFLK